MRALLLTLVVVLLAPLARADSPKIRRVFVFTTSSCQFCNQQKKLLAEAQTYVRDTADRGVETRALPSEGNYSWIKILKIDRFPTIILVDYDGGEPNIRKRLPHGLQPVDTVLSAVKQVWPMRKQRE